MQIIQTNRDYPLTDFHQFHLNLLKLGYIGRSCSKANTTLEDYQMSLSLEVPFVLTMG